MSLFCTELLSCLLVSEGTSGEDGGTLADFIDGTFLGQRMDQQVRRRVDDCGDDSRIHGFSGRQRSSTARRH